MRWSMSLACCAALLPSMGPMAGSGPITGRAQGPVVQQPPATWRILEGTASVVVFNSGDTMDLEATDLLGSGQVTASLGKTWYLISGVDEKPTARSRRLYVVAPGEALARSPHRSWHMAGKLLDHGGTEIFYEAEVFVGEVFPDTVGIVWYDRSLMPDGQWRSNTTLLDLNGPSPDTLVYFGQVRKSTTQRLAFQGKCRQLPGVDQSLHP